MGYEIYDDGKLIAWFAERDDAEAFKETCGHKRMVIRAKRYE